MKRLLSSKDSPVQTVVVENFAGDQTLKVDVCRATFEQINEDYFEKTIAIVQNVLDEQGICKSEIDEVCLAGGSCRIPKIQKMVADFFGKEPRISDRLDTAVAWGAAIYAARLAVVNEVTSHSMGVRTKSDRMAVLVKKNTRIPLQTPYEFLYCF